MLKKLALIMAIALLLGTVFTLPVKAAAATSYSISGTITLNGVGLKGVTVKIPGTTLSAVTNASGNYSIHLVPIGSSGTVVPTLSNYTFSPVSLAFTNIRATLTGNNFAATQTKVIVHTITGTVTKGGVGLAGVLITFGSFTATTSTAGTYRLANVPEGSKGKIVPSLAGYAFTPASITVAATTGALTNQNFTAVVVYTVSGKVTDKATGLPLGGVTVSLGSHSAVTNSTTGAYNIANVPAGTSGSLIASLAGKTFTPTSIAISNLQASLHSQNFVAAP